MEHDFTITIREAPSGGVELALAGEVDAVTSARLREALATAVVGRRGLVVVVDAAAVTFIDSTGLHTLLDADRTFHESGGRLSLINRSPIVERVLQLVGLSDHFADHPASTSRARTPPWRPRSSSS